MHAGPLIVLNVRFFNQSKVYRDLLIDILSSNVNTDNQRVIKVKTSSVFAGSFRERLTAQHNSTRLDMDEYVSALPPCLTHRHTRIHKEARLQIASFAHGP